MSQCANGSKACRALIKTPQNELDTARRRLSNIEKD